MSGMKLPTLGLSPSAPQPLPSKGPLAGSPGMRGQGSPPESVPAMGQSSPPLGASDSNASPGVIKHPRPPDSPRKPGSPRRGPSSSDVGNLEVVDLIGVSVHGSNSPPSRSRKPPGSVDSSPLGSPGTRIRTNSPRRSQLARNQPAPNAIGPGSPLKCVGHSLRREDSEPSYLASQIPDGAGKLPSSDGFPRLPSLSKIGDQSKLQATQYFHDHKIQQLMSDMTAELALHQPQDPVRHLYNKLGSLLGVSNEANDDADSPTTDGSSYMRMHLVCSAHGSVQRAHLVRRATSKETNLMVLSSWRDEASARLREVMDPLVDGVNCSDKDSFARSPNSMSPIRAAMNQAKNFAEATEMAEAAEEKEPSGFRIYNAPVEQHEQPTVVVHCNPVAGLEDEVGDLQGAMADLLIELDATLSAEVDFESSAIEVMKTDVDRLLAAVAALKSYFESQKNVSQPA